MLLIGEDVYIKVSVLSGGERAKLAFAILMAERGNFLLLDEPTNHLDLRSKEILEDALAEFPGTMLFVSHDRYLLRRVPDKIIEIFSDHVEVFPGNYDYYMEKQEAKERAAAAAAASAAAAAPPAPAETAPKAGTVSYNRGKEQRAASAKIRARIKALEKRMEEIDEEIAEINAEMAAEGLDYEKLQELCARLEALHTEQDEGMEEWLELSEG